MFRICLYTCCFCLAIVFINFNVYIHADFGNYKFLQNVYIHVSDYLYNLVDFILISINFNVCIHL